MSTVMNALTKAAVTYGKVNPKHPEEVDRFYRKTILTLSPKKRQAIFNEVFSATTGLDATLTADRDEQRNVNSLLKLTRAVTASRKAKKRAAAAL